MCGFVYEFMCVKVHVEGLFLRTCVSVRFWDSHWNLGLAIWAPAHVLATSSCCSLLDTSPGTIENGQLPQCVVSLPDFWGLLSGPHLFMADMQLTGSLPNSGLPFLLYDLLAHFERCTLSHYLLFHTLIFVWHCHLLSWRCLFSQKTLHLTAAFLL